MNSELKSMLYRISNNFSDYTAMLVLADWCQEHEECKLESFLRWLAARVQKKKFDPIFWILFTGSRRYGVPKEDSDFDWCIFTHGSQLDEFGLSGLKTVLGEEDIKEYRYSSTICTFRAGPVNILAVNGIAFTAWKQGTDELVADVFTKGRPVTRNEAIRVLDVHFLRTKRIDNYILEVIDEEIQVPGVSEQ